MSTRGPPLVETKQEVKQGGQGERQLPLKQGGQGGQPEIDFCLHWVTDEDKKKADGPEFEIQPKQVNGQTVFVYQLPAQDPKARVKVLIAPPVNLYIPRYPAYQGGKGQEFKVGEGGQRSYSMSIVLSAYYIFELRKLDERTSILYDGQVPGKRLQRVVYDHVSGQIVAYVCGKPREPSTLFGLGPAEKLVAQFKSYTEKGFVDVRPLAPDKGTDESFLTLFPGKLSGYRVLMSNDGATLTELVLSS